MTLLGEMDNFDGHFGSNGRIAYVEQEPYIYADSFSNNIIFGR